MDTYRVAILGCRSRGTCIARAYHAHPRTEVVGLCDLVEELRDTLGEELGVSARFADLDEMIEKTKPHIVAIPTGTEFHYDLSMRVLEHGVHIDVEKPMCVDLEQADAVMAKAQEKGARVAVHHQGRVNGFMRAAWRLFEEGRLGEVSSVRASGKGYYGGYGLMNIGTHLLNNVLKFAGHCRSVSAVALTGGHPITPEDVVIAPSGKGTVAGEHIAAVLHFDDGVTATLVHRRFPKPGYPGSVLEVLGTEGRLVWQMGAAWWQSTPHYLPDGEHDKWERLEPVCPDHYEPNRGVSQGDYWFAEEYVQALDEGRDHECSGSEARHVVEILMGVLESAAYGKRIDLPQERRDHPLLRWRKEHQLGELPAGPRPYAEWLAQEDQRLGRGGDGNPETSSE